MLALARNMASTDGVSLGCAMGAGGCRDVEAVTPLVFNVGAAHFDAGLRQNENFTWQGRVVESVVLESVVVEGVVLESVVWKV